MADVRNRGDVEEVEPALALGIATVRIDRHGTIRSASAAAAALLGYAPHELSGMTLADLSAPGGRAAVQGATSRMVFGDRSPFDLELLGPGGQRRSITLALRRLVEAGPDEVEFITEWEKRPASNGREHNGRDKGRFAYELMRSHESERFRIKCAVHDGVIPLVHVAKFALESAMQMSTRGAFGEAADQLSAATRHLKTALDDLGKIASELRPSILDDLGFVSTMSWYCREFERRHRTLRVESAIKVREDQVADHLKLDLFRIIQECMVNAVRHSNATRLRVTLAIEDGELVATVDDDGAGFEAGELLYGNVCLLGTGLQSISHRIHATRGRLLLDSGIGRGTFIGGAWKLNGASLHS